MDTGNTKARVSPAGSSAARTEHALEEFRDPVSVAPRVNRDRSRAGESAEC
jgi:hypothetical protein